MKKRLLSLVLTIVLSLTMFPAFITTANAAGSITEAEVLERLTSAEQQPQWKNGAVFDDSKTLCGSCFGFCRELFRYVFGVSLPRRVNREHARLAGDYMQNIKEIGHLDTGYSLESLKGLLSAAKPGDVLIASHSSANHLVMIRAVESGGSGIRCYDANWNRKNGIRTNGLWSAEDIRKNRPVAVTLYRCVKYDVTSTYQPPESESPISSTTLTANSLTTPGNLIKGQDGHIGGSFASSNSPICSVKAEVCDTSGRACLTATSSGFSVTTYGQLKGSKIDKNLSFSKLPVGSYYIKYTVATKDGTSDTFKTETFTVSEKSAPVCTTHQKGQALYSEAVHPHNTYYKCSVCGQTFPEANYDADCEICNPKKNDNPYDQLADIAQNLTKPEIVQPHQHTKDNPIVSPEHPHNILYTCSDCGEIYFGGTTTVDSCESCNPKPPEKHPTPWSEWTRTPITSSSTREVELRTVKVSDGYTEYRYGRYVAGTHDCWCAKYLEGLSYVSGRASLQYSNWSTTRYSTSGKGWSCGHCNGTHIGADKVGADGRLWWAEYLLPDGSYYWEESRQTDAVYETQYRYRDWISG